MDGFTPLASWGIPGFIIAVLSGVIAYQNRKLDQKDSQIQALQEARLQDFKEREDKLVAPIELVGRNTQFIYDKMISGK